MCLNVQSYNKKIENQQFEIYIYSFFLGYKVDKLNILK